MLSLKERFAKKKTKKQLQKLDRSAKENAKKATQYKSAPMQFSQYRSRKRMVLHARDYGGTFFTDDEIAQQRQTMQNQLDDLIYYRDLGETIAAIEMSVRAARIMADLLDSVSIPRAKDLHDTVNKAIDEMELAQVYDMSPSQRRAAFKDLECMFDLMCIWLKIFSKEVFETIKSVNIATQTCHYFLELYVHVHETNALVDVINGANSRQLAAQKGLKESELKLKLFQAARRLYRIARSQDECVASGLYYPSSIPDLRQKAFRYLANFDFLSTLSAANLTKIIKPFRKEYGIDLLEIEKYEARIVQEAKKTLLPA